MVATKAKPAEEKVGTGWEGPTIAPERRTDPRAYVEARQSLLNQAMSGKMPSTDFRRICDAIGQECLANTGIPYEEATRAGQDKIAAFMGLMDHSEAELRQVEAAIAHVDDLRMTDDVKKKYRGWIERVIRLQRRCREDPVIFGIYVDRNDDARHAGEVLEMAPCHLEMFEIWRDPAYLHSLTEAPVGHGKSKNLRILIPWEIGHQPELRCLFLTDERGKAEKTAMVVKKMLRSPRYRAIFPEVRVLTRMDKAEDKTIRFTVGRINEFARDPTFEGAGIRSEIQGNRYDRIYADDVCPPEVREHPGIRSLITNKWLSVVEGRLADVHSRIRMICTPWHPDDIAGVIERQVANGQLGNWRVEIDRFRIKDDEKGRAIPIWDKWDRNFLEDRKIRDGVNYDYKYRLRFSSERTQIVRRVMYYDADPRTQNARAQELQEQIGQAEKWLSIDPAGSASKHGAADTGIIEIVISPRGYVFFTNCWTLHCPIGGVIEHVRDLILQCSPPGYEGVQWESQGGVKVGMPAVLDMLRIKLAEAGYVGDVKMITTGTSFGGVSNASKTNRLIQSAGYIENVIRFAGRGFHNDRFKPSDPKGRYLGPVPGSPIALFIEDLLNYDGTRGTDKIDAFTQWILHNKNRIQNPNVGQITRRDLPAEPLDPMGEAMKGSLAAVVARMKEEAEFGRDSAFDEQHFLIRRFGRKSA